KRSRSATVNVLAFFRIRTITRIEPTSVVPARASSVTSPLLLLGRPNLPATKNGTDVPLLGTGRVTALENAPVVSLRNTISPPPDAGLPVIRTLRVGEVAPEGLVIRIRHGQGAHGRTLAVGLVLLLIWNSTSIVTPRSPVS